MTVPFDRQLWNAQQCAAYLGLAYGTFVKKTQYVADLKKLDSTSL